MPAQFESANSPIVREPTMMNGTTPYTLNDDVVISGFSGKKVLLRFTKYTMYVIDSYLIHVFFQVVFRSRWT